ncbi:hypothetical protein MAR_015620, partial [Mya arenaria]
IHLLKQKAGLRGMAFSHDYSNSTATGDILGVDQYGELCHSGMYKRLLTNSPKECCEYVDYTFQK